MRFLIRLYQRYLSPLLGPHCRFSPTCSSYADAAIGRFGYLRGTALAVGRICRCNPWGPCGYDPVPDVFGWRAVFFGCVEPAADDDQD